MIKLARLLVAAAMLLLFIAPHPSAQSASLQGDVLKDWTRMKDTMMKISGAMPEEKFGYKPTAAQRSYGEQIVHVAQANVMFIKMLGGKTPVPTLNTKPTAKADILKVLSDSYDYGASVINEQTNESLVETVQASFLGPSTRARVVWAAIGHAWDEYGVMTTYLRLNGIVPPASAKSM
jgi:uncharacterized damage-inducible protein DinB